MKKLVAFMLAAFMLLSLAACGPKIEGGGTYTNPYADLEYDEASAKVYDDVLGEFYAAYNEAKKANSVSEKFALMAIAEAKFLETALFLPTTSNGGNYAISRTAPNTVTSVLWGNDSYRYHQILVATEPITAEHRAEMKAKWAEVKGTGTYEEWAKSYLQEKGYTIKDSYTLTYSADPQTWDVLATSEAVDSEAIINTYDGLYEYDIENVLKPALAESYEKNTNDDGTVTYTFKIREGEWVNSQGVKVADIKADDFVAGMQHMMDAQAGLEYLVEGIIVNASEYINGDITDFSQVGVKAVDDRTLEYTLTGDVTYFMTMLGYGVFAPMSREYYTSKGGKFGADYDAAAEDYTYGTTPDDIAYCGPYTVTNLTAENTIVFSANASYWNKDKINVKSIRWLYNDGTTAVLKAYTDMKDGTIDGCGLNASALEQAKKDGIFDSLHYVSATDATTFGNFFNVNRTAFANCNDENTVVSGQTKEEAGRTMAAMRNQNFRLALAFSFDRGTYNSQSVGEELKLLSLQNSFTPGTFVSLEEKVTVKINGKDKTYDAGTYYGQIVQDQLDADKYPIKVWDPTADEGNGSSSGFDGWYNVENAKKYLKKAIKELEKEGVAVTKEYPIQIDLPSLPSSKIWNGRAQTVKQSIESALEGKVVVNLVVCEKSQEFYYAGYWTDYGYEANYDIYNLSGWGPDYGDPSTYLDSMLPEYAGFMVKCLGIY